MKDPLVFRRSIQSASLVPRPTPFACCASLRGKGCCCVTDLGESECPSHSVVNQLKFFLQKAIEGLVTVFFLGF